MKKVLDENIPENCINCPAHNAANLVKLGVDPENTDYVICLAGNPNTGKSTVFNSLTGLRQHTGNWPGKTVSRMEGGFVYDDNRYKIVDLPGTYSLLSTSTDEEVARDFILFGRPDVTVIVVDATRLERNLNLVLQVLEITNRAVLALNLIDEAQRNNLEIDVRGLSKALGIPVIPMVARRKQGQVELLQAIDEVATGKFIGRPPKIKSKSKELGKAIQNLSEEIVSVYPELPNVSWIALRLLEGDNSIIQSFLDGSIGSLEGDEAEYINDFYKKGESIVDKANQLRWTLGLRFHDTVVESIYANASEIAHKTVRQLGDKEAYSFDLKVDKIVTNKWLGFPIMFAMLAMVFWLTITGANYPSSILAQLLIDQGHPWLKGLADAINTPSWISGLLIDGGYLAMAWVIAVMLPPMAIFFPLFTLLEDLGYLPRVAFNMDSLFRKSGAHGKQALSMTMGFGCNAAGVVATRVIDSPRERLIAIVTNNFSLCNGRWPTQILLATIFIGTLAPAALASTVSAAAVVLVAVLGIGFSLIVSWGLSKTLLNGTASSFSLELPPYRPPRIWQTLYTSFIDRTLIVLWRAVVFAIPAGLIIWLVSNVEIGDQSIAHFLVAWMDPFALIFGLNGVILLAYIIAIPANEIVIPTVLMLTVLTANLSGVGEGAGVMFEMNTMEDTAKVLEAGGWTVLTGVNVMLFSLLHNPCSTTIMTIYRETQSAKWVLISTILPIILGLIVTFFTTQIYYMI